MRIQKEYLNYILKVSLKIQGLEEENFKDILIKVLRIIRESKQTIEEKIKIKLMENKYSKVKDIL